MRGEEKAWNNKTESKIMKRAFLKLSLILASADLCRAGLVFSDTFTEVNGTALIGHTPDSGSGAWIQDGVSSVNPITINNNAISLANTGQDARSIFSSSVTAVAGQSLYLGLSLNVSAAVSGDYFLTLYANGGASDSRLYAKSTTGGFLLGLQTATTASIAYGTTVLSLNNTYQIVMRHDFINGAGNDTMGLYVNPISGEGNNSTYITVVGTGGTDPTSILGIFFRQGTTGAAPTLTVDNLTVGTSFDDVVSVPEPAAWGAVSGIGLLGLCGFSAWREHKQKHKTGMAK